MSAGEGRGIYGALSAVGTLKGQAVLGHVRDPWGRYVGVARGRSVAVVDVWGEAPVVVAEHREVYVQGLEAAIHPEGARVAVRNGERHRLRVQGHGGAAVEVATPTVRLTWNGERVAAGAARPMWGWADEHLMYSADGAWVVLASHGEDGRACVLLYEAETLALVDRWDDLRAYSPYVTWTPVAEERPEYVPMGVWSESWLAPDRLDPSVILGVRNGGDSCVAVVGLRIEGGRIVPVDPGALSRAVFGVDAYCMQGLCLLPAGGLLVVDRDHQLARLAWPPDPALARVARVSSTEHLRDEEYMIRLPFRLPPWVEVEDLSGSGALTITERHVLMNIEGADGTTVAMVAFDPMTLAPLGLVERPRSRVRFEEVAHLGRDVFAASSGASCVFWRLGVEGASGGSRRKRTGTPW